MTKIDMYIYIYIAILLRSFRLFWCESKSVSTHLEISIQMEPASFRHSFSSSELVLSDPTCSLKIGSAFAFSATEHA